MGKVRAHHRAAENDGSLCHATILAGKRNSFRSFPTQWMLILPRGVGSPRASIPLYLLFARQPLGVDDLKRLCSLCRQQVQRGSVRWRETVKTSDLEGAQLDYWVARAEVEQPPE